MEKRTKKKEGSRTMSKFWLAVLVIYSVAFLSNRQLFWNSLEATGQTLLKILPIILFVFAIMILSNLFLTPERIKKHFSHEAGIKGWLYAMLFGILIAGPSYILYPMLKEMKAGGLRTGYLTAFLYNRNVKIPFIPVMIYYFGWQYTIVVTGLIIIFSIISGIIMERIIN